MRIHELQVLVSDAAARKEEVHFIFFPSVVYLECALSVVLLC
jgi:hypothetical protein